MRPTEKETGSHGQRDGTTVLEGRRTASLRPRGSRNEVRSERPHLNRAKPATSPRNHTHVLVHWESCLQGLVDLTEPARADSDNRDRGPEQPFRLDSDLLVPGRHHDS